MATPGPNMTTPPDVGDVISQRIAHAIYNFTAQILGAAALYKTASFAVDAVEQRVENPAWYRVDQHIFNKTKKLLGFSALHYGASGFKPQLIETLDRGKPIAEALLTPAIKWATQDITRDLSPQTLCQQQALLNTFESVNNSGMNTSFIPDWVRAPYDWYSSFWSGSEAETISPTQSITVGELTTQAGEWGNRLAHYLDKAQTVGSKAFDVPMQFVDKLGETDAVKYISNLTNGYMPPSAVVVTGVAVVGYLAYYGLSQMSRNVYQSVFSSNTNTNTANGNNVNLFLNQAPAGNPSILPQHASAATPTALLGGPTTP